MVETQGSGTYGKENHCGMFTYKIKIRNRIAMGNSCKLELQSRFAFNNIFVVLCPSTIKKSLPLYTILITISVDKVQKTTRSVPIVYIVLKKRSYCSKEFVSCTCYTRHTATRPTKLISIFRQTQKWLNDEVLVID